MLDSGNQSKKINGKWLAIGAGLLLCVMVLPSFFFLAKIAIGLITITAATISVKAFLKATSNTSEEKKTDQNQVAQQTTRSKIAVGLTSIFALLLSTFIVVKVGLIAAACAAVTALILYDCLQDKEIGRYINNKLDEIAESTTDFIVSNIEKLIPQQSCQA